MTENQRDVMEYEVAIVGGGPAGLACAIRLKQLNPDLSVCVLEKAASLGAHSLSGAVLEPGPLDELLPSWREHAPAICVPATRDEFVYLTRRNRYKMPMTPPQMVNHGNFIVSLGQLIPILGAEAEKLGVDVFAGFAAAEALFDEAGAVKGVRIGDMGVEKNGEPGPNFALGPGDPRQGHPVLRGVPRQHLETAHPPLQARRRQVAANLRPRLQGAVAAAARARAARAHPTHRGLAARQPNLRRKLSLPSEQRSGVRRFVVGLDYEDPRFKPFEAFQQFKNHPSVKALLKGGEILAGGARTVIEGGYQSMPTLEMPGAMLVGDAGGTLNTPKIKGIHQAIRSGMTAAAHYVETGGSAGFDKRWRESPGGRELYKVRNIRPGFKHGLWLGLANAGLETVTLGKFRGRSPITPTTRRSSAWMNTSLPIGSGETGNCRRAIGWHSCFLPPPPTRKISRFTSRSRT